jgi:hypothetical protein
MMNDTFDARGDGLQVLWEDGERVVCRALWQHSDSGSGTVLTAVLAAEHPPPAASIALLTNLD